MGFSLKSSGAIESPGQTQQTPLVGCSPESEQRTISSTDKYVVFVQSDPESTDQDRPKPDASMRDVQKPSEPSTPIDKGIQSDVGCRTEREPVLTLSSTSPALTKMFPKQPVLPEYPGTKFSSLSLDDSSLSGINSIHGLVTMSKKTCVCFACTEFGKDLKSNTP